MNTTRITRLRIVAWVLTVALMVIPATSSLASPPTDDCSIGTDYPAGSLSVIGGSSAPFGGTAIRTFTIEVENGLGLDGVCLAEQVQAVLGDPRSWIHEGNLGWQRVDTNPDLRIIFSSPGLTDQLCAPLNTGGIYSCRSGNRTVLNTVRWRSGTPEYQLDLNAYRTYQINHEVGHFLGHGHTTCPGSGRAAPVMMQQTKGLDGCAMNGWPFPEVAVPPEVWQGRFKDDDDSIFEGAIEWIAAQGITLGCNPPDNDRYCPNQSVTRGEMAAFLDRALSLPGTDADFFADDTGTVFESAVNRAAEAGITYGCKAGTSFCADRTISREEMAAFLRRSPLIVELGSPTAFTDVSTSMFITSIEWLSSAGITQGCNPPANDHFCPGNPVTRGEMAAFLRRTLDLQLSTPTG